MSVDKMAPKYYQVAGGDDFLATAIRNAAKKSITMSVQLK
jgi:hypothetical protein